MEQQTIINFKRDWMIKHFCHLYKIKKYKKVKLSSVGLVFEGVE